MQADLKELEDRHWDAAHELRANSGLKASEYAAPVLGLIFLRFADVRFEAARERIVSKATSPRKIGPGDYQAEGLVYLAPQARFGALLDLPEGSNLGKAVNGAMGMIEENNPDLNKAFCRAATRRSRMTRSPRCSGTSAATRRTAKATRSV